MLETLFLPSEFIWIEKRGKPNFELDVCLLRK